MPNAGIYAHIPFCRAKCAYCDFVSFPGMEALYDSYVEALCLEAAQRAPYWTGTRFDTLFVGGGTPTVLPVRAVEALLAACRQRLDLENTAEISIEANPGTVDGDALRALRRAGINRLSLGVQSLDDGELTLLGRIHSRAEALAALALAREAGFGNVNLDLMLGLPGQRLSHWRRTLEEVAALGPEHLSIYILSLEGGTALSARVSCGALPEPDEDEVAAMYELTERLLAQAGYAHYEISNWARRSPGDAGGELPALACRHNLKYWRNEAYLGLGAAAHGYDGAVRYANIGDPAAYIARVRGGKEATATRETLDDAQRMGETMMLGLRLTLGVERQRFQERFGRCLDEVYAQQIEELAREGLLEADARGVRLTARGRLLGNRVFAAFLPNGGA
jgi:oxygen-independent coproporphyrinogen-3 oxidase